MNITGQGIWIWQLPRCCRGDMERVIDECQRMLLGHVLIKCVDGRKRYKTNATHDAYVIGKLRECGIHIIGWGFHYAKDPEAEAEMAVRACRDLGHTLYICNAEKEFEQRGGAQAAARFVAKFRELAGSQIELGLSTFALPSLHPRFPYDAFLNGENACRFVMPQIYTVPSRRHPFLQSLRSYWQKAQDELHAFSAQAIPTLRAYTGDGMFDWQAIADDASDFLASARSENMPAWNWWVWQSAETNRAMWRALAEFDHD